jgi:hypothetical protein
MKYHQDYYELGGSTAKQKEVAGHTAQHDTRTNAEYYQIRWLTVNLLPSVHPESLVLD